VRPAIDATLSAAHLLRAPDSVWRCTRWKGCDPGPTDPRDNGVLWPSLEHQNTFDATSLKRWRALRAAHDILWGDPMSSTFAADHLIKQRLPLLPTGVLRRFQDPYKETTRVLQFTKEAVQDFLQHHGYTRVIRGHQGKGAGGPGVICNICS
jgi:hypothetical protein